MWKEFALTIAAVIVALIVFNMIAKKVPALKGNWESDEA